MLGLQKTQLPQSQLCAWLQGHFQCLPDKLTTCEIADQSADPAVVSWCCEFQISCGVTEGVWLHFRPRWAKSQKKLTQVWFTPITCSSLMSLQSSCFILSNHKSGIMLCSCNTRLNYWDHRLTKWLFSITLSFTSLPLVYIYTKLD